MKRWVGRWVVLVGVIHCVFGAVVFFVPWHDIVRDGLWNAVGGYPGRPLAFWFELVGLMMILFGLALDEIEKRGQGLPAALGYGFASVTVLSIVAMPVSGAWLLLPPPVGLIVKKAK